MVADCRDRDHPILAIAALYFAIKGDVRRAIMAIAGRRHRHLALRPFALGVHSRLEFLTGGVTGLHLFGQTVVFHAGDCRLRVGAPE